MSNRAYENYSLENLQILNENYEIKKIPFETIEKIGGGSVRCCITELF